MAYLVKETAYSLALEIPKYNNNEKLRNDFEILFSGDYRSAVSMFRKIGVPSEARVLAAFYKFSKRQSNDHRLIKQQLCEDWTGPEDVYEILGAIGSFYGYSTLDARETKLYSVHPLLRNAVEERPEIKFHLNTKFERQMIESLYDRIFYSEQPREKLPPMFNDIRIGKTHSPNKLNIKYINNSSYTVGDLLINRYEITIIGQLFKYLDQWKNEYIDDRTEVGKYLMSECFRHCEDYQIIQQGANRKICYKILKQKLINLLVTNKIDFNPRVLKIALEEDGKVRGK